MQFIKVSVILCALGPSFAIANWKPITGTSSFSLNQKLPLLGTPISSTSSVTYHGNTFLEEYSSADSSPLLSGQHGIGGALGLDAATGGNSDVTSYLGNKILEQTPFVSEHCRADKYALEYEGTLRFEQSLPKLDQFTLCNWMRFTNHTGDHTIFTYSLHGKDREIQLWIANTPEASFISLAVQGQSLYRLNYPFRYGRWHHQCTSWNGKTGEWQLWIRGERIGRGFHNRLVGHVIKPGGTITTGGPSITGPVADGLHTEITMVQMYKVALSAGKAHRDHKHHHVHKFGHNGPAATMPAPAQPTAAPQQPANPLLANGQIPSRVRINLAGQQTQEQSDFVNGQAIPVSGIPSQLAGNGLQTVTTQFANGQFHPGNRIRTQQLLAGVLPTAAAVPQPRQVLQPTGSVFTFPGSPAISSESSSYINLGSPANVQFIDEAGDSSHILFKRQNDKSKTVLKRETAEAKVDDDSKKVDKRALVMLTNGQIIDDSLLDQAPFEFDGLAQFGAPEFKEYLTKMMETSNEEVKEYDREPAEGEVMAVMNLCSYCEEEPFIGALVLAWKNVKIIMQHALRAKTQGGCGQF